MTLQRLSSLCVSNPRGGYCHTVNRVVIIMNQIALETANAHFPDMILLIISSFHIIDINNCTSRSIGVLL